MYNIFRLWLFVSLLSAANVAISAPCIASPDDPAVISSSCSEYIWTSGSLVNDTSITGIGISAALSIPYGDSVGTLTNNGSIEGYNDLAIRGIGDIAGITNNGQIGVITGSSYTIGVEGAVGYLTNQSHSIISNGEINGNAIYVAPVMSPSIGTLENYGTIASTGNYSSGVTLDNPSAIINILHNYEDGVIAGSDNGIKNQSLIEVLTNDGVISGTGPGSYGIHNSGAMGELNNSSTGVIVGTFGGIYNDATGNIVSISNNSGTISSIFNSGTIGGESGTHTIYNQGSISSIINSGRIGSESSVDAIYNAGNILSLTNSGDIDSEYGIFNAGTVSNLINIGSIVGSVGTAIYNLEDATITNLNNSGTISGGTAILNVGDIGAINNYGTIQGGIYNYGTISALKNGSGGVITGSNNAIYNDTGTTITKLTNDGRIGTLDGVNPSSQYGILNHGSLFAESASIAEISNGRFGVIMGSYGAINNEAGATITSINNSGTISSSGVAIENGGTIGSFINSGNLSGGAMASVLINHYGATINILTNAPTGVISGGDGIQNNGTINQLINQGSIIGRYALEPNIVGTLINSGVISGSASGIYGGDMSIGNLINTGTISGASDYGIEFWDGSIGTLTNLGTISGGIAGIFSYNIIGTLNNAQSGLNMSFNLPSAYQIILGNNAQTYGTLNFLDGNGTLNRFGIYAGPVKSKLYAGVLSGITDVNNGTTGKYGGFNYQLVQEGDSGIWDLLFPSYLMATNTLTAVQQLASGMSSVYNQQAAAYQAALSYDCQVYDQNNLCVSVGGRYTYAGPSPSANQQAGLVILGYKPVPTFRLGAFADQSVNNTTPTGITQSKSSPMWGLFAKWHMNKDETGLGVQASAVTSASKLTTTRTQLEDTEAGTGSTQFNGQGYQLTTNYHQPVTNNTSLVPYLGLRYTRINAGAYTENTSATVTSPLSYNAMAQNTFSAIGGIGVRSHLAEKLIGTASVGIQQNLNYSMGNYAGTSSISGLETFSVQMPGNVNSMATATAGMFYDINKRERVGVNVLWQQQPFIATNTTTALASYTIGF